MLTIRKIKTKSGATAIQVVTYKGHRAKIVKHIGSSKNNEPRFVISEDFLMTAIRKNIG